MATMTSGENQQLKQMRKIHSEKQCMESLSIYCM